MNRYLLFYMHIYDLKPQLCFFFSFSVLLNYIKMTEDGGNRSVLDLKPPKP